MAKKLVAMLFILFAMNMRLSVGHSEPLVPAVYIFGDSTFDVGTNIFLPETLSRADKLFYGIDFAYSKRTGRFSNGYNTADCIVQLLGFNESPPPFLFLVNNDTSRFNREILKGVNFAGGGAGILDNTGKTRFIKVISMSNQIRQFSIVRSHIISQNQIVSADAMISKSLFLISVGSNDINEFLFKNPRSTIQKVKAFLASVIYKYQVHLKNLIKLGAKKFGILSVAPLGCVPDVRGSYGGNCSDDINVIAQMFHKALHDMLLSLNLEFPETKYSLGNTYVITFEMIDNPAPLGLSDVTRACCGNQTLTDGTPCSPQATLCEDRESFLFWDRHHPTAYGSKLAALSLYSGSTKYVAPTNFSVLVQL